MEKDNHLFYGLGGLILGLICVTKLKNDVFDIVGLFDVTGKSVGILLLVIGGWNLLISEDFANLLGEILALPFRLLGWALEHWYLVLAAVLLFNWFGDKEEAPAKENIHMESATEQPVWTEPAPAETEWVPPATTVPPQPERVVQPYAGMHRNAGLCKNLTRDAEVLLVFVNDSGSTWTDWEIQNFVGNMVEPGLAYIENQAAGYGYSITLEDCVYPDEAGNTKVMQYDGTVTGWRSDAGLNKDLLTSAAQTYGFASTDDMIKNVQDYAGTDQVAVVFCLDKAGRSYAQWHDTVDYFVEYAVVFTSQDGVQNRAGVFSHEVMHLFGADDMYSEGTERVNRAALVQKWHPRELFYRYTWNLQDNIICPYNAYAVGWMDYLPAEYNCAEWWS